MMLQRVLRWIVGLPIALVVISFAVANRQWVTVSFDPFSKDAPFAAVVFFGLIAGWIACWIAQGKWRRSAREARRELKLSHVQSRSTAPFSEEGNS